MNIKRIIAVGVVFVLGVAFAETAASATKQANAPKQKITKEELDRAIMKNVGGKLIKPGTRVGKMVYVNCQKAAPISWIRQNADTFAKFTRLPIDVEEGEFAFPEPRIHGNASLFVVDDPKLPTILHAPENRWAMVNVFQLKQGEGEKEPFFAARVQKELTRGFALLAGAQDSSQQGALIGCITSPAQLDNFVDCRLPLDVISRLVKYSKGYGVDVGVVATYRKACQEGWAPAPTNEFQKAIWDQVRTLPSDPIKITYDPKIDK